MFRATEFKTYLWHCVHSTDLMLMLHLWSCNVRQSKTRRTWILTSTVWNTLVLSPVAFSNRLKKRFSSTLSVWELSIYSTVPWKGRQFLLEKAQNWKILKDQCFWVTRTDHRLVMVLYSAHRILVSPYLQGIFFLIFPMLISFTFLYAYMETVSAWNASSR